MDKELHTLDMRIRPIYFGEVYLNVPGGDRLKYNNSLIDAVEYIGAKYGTVSGSNLKRGIHYIRDNTGCPSKRQIKMMLRNVKNSRFAYAEDSSYLFRCSKVHYIKILKFIISHSAIELPNGVCYSDYLVPDPKRGIQYVSNHAIDEGTQNCASNMYRDLSF